MQESTVTSKGQTTLPRSVRSALGLQPGDKVRYVILHGEVRLLRARPLVSLAGLLRREDATPVSLEQMDEAIAAAAAGGGQDGGQSE